MALPPVGKNGLPPISGLVSNLLGFNNVTQPLDALSHPVQTAEGALPVLGSIGGAMAGAAIPGPDLSGLPEIAGAGIGWNLGQEGENWLQGKGNPKNLLTPSNAINTGLAMGTEGLGRFGTGKITNAATNIANKQLSAPLSEFKTTPTDITNFASKHGSGTGLLDYINKFKSIFPSWDGSAQTFNQEVGQPLSQQYGDALQGVPVNRSDIEAGYNNKINTLKRLNPNNPNSPQIQALENERDNTLMYLDQAHNPKGAFTPFTKGEGRPTQYDGQAVNTYKGIKDTQTPSSQFGLNPQESSNLQRTSGDILRQSLYNAADNVSAQSGQLRQLGLDNKAAYGLGNIADDTNALQQAGKFTPGQTSSKLLTKGVAIRGLAEGGIGALLGAHLGLPPEIAGPLTPALAEGAFALKDPIISGTSATLANPIGKFGARLGAQSLASGVNNILNNTINNGVQNGAGNYNGQEGNHPGNNSTFPLTQQASPPINGYDVTKNYNPKTAQWTVPSVDSLAAPSDAPQMTPNLYDINQAMLKNPAYSQYLQGSATAAQNTINSYLAQKNLTPDQLAAINDLPRYSDNLGQIANTMVTDPTGWWNAIGGKQALQEYRDPKFAVAMGMIKNEQTLSGAQIAGGNATVSEENNVAAMLPKSTDSQATAIGKINALQEMLQKQYYTYGPVAKWYSQVTTQPSGGNVTAGRQQPQSTGLPSKPPTLGPTVYPLQ